MAGIGSNNLREASAGLGLGGERGWFGADVAFLRTDGINACNGTAAGWGAGCFADEPDRDGYRNRSASLRGGGRFGDAWTLEGSALRAEGYNHYDGSWANYSETVQQVFSGKLRFAPSAAASRATSVPRWPMAMPMWAALRAGASFTPSPTMATTRPAAFNSATLADLSPGSTSAITSPASGFSPSRRAMA